MDWKYYIPHVWDRDRQVWEDVYLLPDDGRYDGQALWLTIDALGDVNVPEHGTERAEFQVEALQKLGDYTFQIDGTDMLVRSVDFSREELLKWVQIWLRETRLAVTNLVEGTTEEFRGRAFHVDLIAQLKHRFGCEEK